MSKIAFDKYAGIKDVCDVLETLQPFLRQATNVDINDDGKVVSRRDGSGAPLIAGSYHSPWSNRARTVMLAVVGADLVAADPLNLAVPTRVIRSGLTPGLAMTYAEVNDLIYYSNSQVIGFIEAGMDTAFPAITKTGGSRLPAGHILRYYRQRLYSVLGGRVAPSAALDYGRAVLRKDFLWFAGHITMFEAVDDGIYMSYGNTTVFLAGSKPNDFVVKPVADYPAISGTAEVFDASLVSGRVPLQGPAVYWMSTEGPCIGYAGGQMINLALTKVIPLAGHAGASIVRKNRKGFMQVLTVLQT